MSLHRTYTYTYDMHGFKTFFPRGGGGGVWIPREFDSLGCLPVGGWGGGGSSVPIFRKFTV